MKAIPIVLGLLTVGGLSAWTPSHLADEPKTISANDLREVLKSLDAKAEEAKDDEEKTYWMVTAKEGVKFLLFQYGGKGDAGTSISASAVFKSEATVSDVNTWNSSHRFYKVFTTDKGVMFESDLDVSVAPSKATVKKFISDFAVAAKKYLDE